MAETIEVDDESWSEVIVTLAISTATSAIFLTIYEIARRSPKLIEVFDRRRITKPNRTPPPLLRNSLFEWLFLSNDPTYSEYSDLAFMRDVIREKRKQRHPERKGFFSFSRGSDNKKSHKTSILNDPKEIRTNMSYGNDDEESGHNPKQSHKNNNAPVKEVVALDTNSPEVEINIQNNPEIDTDSPSSKQIKHPLSKVSKKKITIRKHLTPDVVEVNGWRLPKEVAEYALANDLTEDQLYDYEQRLLEQERLDEIEFQQRRRDMAVSLGIKSKRFFVGEDSFDARIHHATLDELESDVTLKLPPRRSRLWYFGFQHGWNFGSEMASKYKMNSPTSFTNEGENDVHLNRHLKSVSVLRNRPLSASDSELLRCIGLDTFVMIRFLRFCFDVTFYPFIFACTILMPLYSTNNFEGDILKEDGTVKTQTGGYFQITINRLEPSSSKLWACWGFTVLFLLFILRRLWIEWETFLPLRFDFLANGDVENEKDGTSFKSRSVVAPQDDVQLHLEQYRNSCMVEYIPDSHRRDRELFQFFEAVFPGQVKRAEVLLNATDLTVLMKKRQKLIEKYEKISAKFSYENKRYRTAGDNSSCFECRPRPKKPEDPVMRLGNSRCFCCSSKVVKALPYLLAEIKRMNRLVDAEYKKVTQDKLSAEDKAEQNDLFHKAAGTMKTMMTGEGTELVCDTGFVEFTNITAKQSALQCNITGTNGYMVLSSAPDPRDVVWDNATVEKQNIIIKNAQCALLLFTGTLFWFAVVGFITSLSNLDQYKEKEILPVWFFPAADSIYYDLMQGYLPVILLELLMLVVPFTLRIIAKYIIRFKTYSEIDQFVYKWHFAYRVTNLISIIVRQQVLKTLDLFLNSPISTIDYLAGTIAISSQFFLNNILVSAGTETFFELSQLIKIGRHIILNRFITVEATSKRELERLREPISLEWGEKIPPFIFALLVASIYSAVVPIVMGACALYFYVAAKIYTHQALFIYAQPYEGGGKLMYLLNRSVFAIIYISICFFSAILGLKNAGVAITVGFLVLMLFITFVVDRWITTRFVNPSTTLALTNARIIDEETKALNERKRLYEEFKREKRRRRKDEEETSIQFHDRPIGSNDYLPSQLFLADGSIRRSSSDLDEGGRHSSSRKSRRKVKSSQKNRNDLSPLENDSNNSEDAIDKFYLYRQPQLNKTTWETKPSIGKW